MKQQFPKFETNWKKGEVSAKIWASSLGGRWRLTDRRRESIRALLPGAVKLVMNSQGPFLRKDCAGTKTSVFALDDELHMFARIFFRHMRTLGSLAGRWLFTPEKSPIRCAKPSFVLKRSWMNLGLCPIFSLWHFRREFFLLLHLYWFNFCRLEVPHLCVFQRKNKHICLS